MSITKILLVDDLKLTLEIAKSALTNSGAVILTASDGAEALTRVKAEKPDLIFMDLFMPNMGGDECCKLVKEDPTISHIPIILTSSTARLNGLDKNIISLCDGIMEKPFSKSEFLEKVKEHVEIICRSHPRLVVSFDISFIHGEKVLRGRIANISRGGVYIESEQTLPVGTKTSIAVTSKQAGFFELFGKVVWSCPNSNQSDPKGLGGMGIKFLEQDSAYENAMIALTGDLSSSLDPA